MTTTYNSRLQPVTIQAGTATQAASLFSVAYDVAYDYVTQHPLCAQFAGRGNNGNVQSQTITHGGARGRNDIVTKMG